MPHLSKAFVRVAKCQEGKNKQEFYDNELKGFLLEVRANGRKTFYLRNTASNGVRKSIRIGDASVLDAESARVKALKLKRSIEEGKDVIIATEDIKTPKESVITLGAFYNEYYLPHIQKHIKSYAANRSLFVNHILPLFKNTPMHEVKKVQVMKLHSDMVQKKRLAPATANKILIFLSNAYNVAKDLEIEGIDNNPVSGIKPFEENNARERYLTKEETTRLLEAINSTQQNIHLKYIIPFLILTGARRGEVLKAKHEDFNFEQLTWTIPISKSGKKRVLPITPHLLELYSQIPKGKTPYLFASPTTNKPYITIYCSWNSARVKAGLPDVRLHDLRHSFASALVNAGRSLYEVQTLLGHSTSKMTQRYAHLSNESLMSAASSAGRLFE